MTGGLSVRQLSRCNTVDMTSDQQHKVPSTLGGDWDRFLSEWCLGNPPATESSEVVRGLEALARLWPERIREAAASPVRGLTVVVPLVDTGLTLAHCESLAGFDAVLRRARGGERSAGFELRFARHAQRAGYSVQLEPKLNGKVLDTLILDSGEPVFCEAIAPDISELMGAAKDRIMGLAEAVVSRCLGKHVEVLLLKDLDDQIGVRLLEVVNALPATEEPIRIGEEALVQVSPGMQAPVVSPRIPAPQSLAVLGAASVQVQGSVSTSAIVRLPVSDQRAKRLIYAESHQFSRETKNVLVIDTTAVPGGMTGWLPLIRRTFQPGQNRRFGSIILHSRGLIGESMDLEERWEAVQNPYAYRPVAPEFLQRFCKLL